MSALADLQEWMLGTLQAGRIEPASARAELATQLEGLAVYVRGYRARLLACLQAEFPALRRLLGSRLFDDFALAALGEHPPATWALHDLGANLLRWLEETRPDAGDPQPTVWVQRMVELARLERAFSEVYRAPGPEGLPTLQPPAGELLAPRALALVPGLRVLRLSSRLGPWMVAARRDEEPPLPPPEPCAVAIFRRNWRVRIEPLQLDEAACLQRLLAGASLGAVLAPLPDPDAWIRRCVERGLLSASAGGAATPANSSLPAT